MRKIKKNNKYFKIANLFNLSVVDVYNHIQKLYTHIAKQRKKIKKLKLKITKMQFLSKLDAHIVKTQQQEEVKCEKTDNTTKSNVIDKKEEEKVLDFINDIKNQALMNSYEQAGFIYEPTSGLYWDSKSGLYWNPESDLYYNGNDGNWYKLNPITNEFTFHSSTEAAKAVKKSEKDEEKAIRKILEEGRKPLKCQEKVSSKDDKIEKNRRRSSSDDDDDSDSSDYRRRKRNRRSRSRSKSRSRSRRRNRKSRSREDGELDDDSSVSSESDHHYRENVQKKRKRKKGKGNEYEEIAKKYPPSLRLIVSESQVNNIQVGHLFVVTFKGGSLGREGEHHNVLLTAENVSKEHLKFSYNNKKGIYQLIDMSRNGTKINDKQVSLLNKTECEPQNLHHGDILEIAHVKLLVHIHKGLETCNDCEPFNYTQKPQEQPAKPAEDYVPSLSHKEQLKLLQKRYGLQSEKYQEAQPGTSNKNYEDRASQRRKKVGSSHDKEKTVQASVDRSISSENKGFKLLSKMGWNSGEALGKNNETAIKEPVQLKTQGTRSGLGHEDFTTSSSSAVIGGNKKKQEIWSKTQERYNKLKDDKN